ncbi:MAG: hypothetical protein KJ624_08310 [Chloroflexi bacterium]|nr:hypothetical protein [Chloroflexota bacterium]
MNRGQKVVLGVVVVGGTALAVSALSKRAEAAPPPVVPPSLVEGYLSDIAASLTLDALAAVRVRFEGDYVAGKLTQPEYQQVYDAYLVRYGELVGPATATLDIKAVPVLAGPYGTILAPKVYVDGAWVGSAPVLWTLYPGTYTISWEDKPGGDNPAPGVAYYQAPAAQTVTVAAGQTLVVEGTYTIVPAVVVPPNITLDAFWFSNVQPFLPSSTHIAYINITNPTNRTINYYFDAYPFNPGNTGGEVAGRIGVGDIGPIPPGSWGTQLGITMPAAEGVYPLFLRFYENVAGFPLAYIKTVNTGQSVTVGSPPPPPPPPPPPGWPIIQQLASIYSYLSPGMGVWNEAGTLGFDPTAPYYPPSDLQELLVGQRYWISVTQACTLSYGGKTWNLAAGWNLITW